MAFNEINDEMFIVTVTCKIAIVNSYLFIKILSYALPPMRDVALDVVCLSRMRSAVVFCSVS